MEPEEVDALQEAVFGDPLEDVCGNFHTTEVVAVFVEVEATAVRVWAIVLPISKSATVPAGGEYDSRDRSTSLRSGGLYSGIIQSR